MEIGGVEQGRVQFTGLLEIEISSQLHFNCTFGLSQVAYGENFESALIR